MLGLELPFLYNLVDIVLQHYGEAYPDLIQNKEKIKSVIKQEEERFKLTLDRGYKLLEDLLADKKDISGVDAFKLYDTFGFPLELTVEIAQEQGLSVDMEGFKSRMAEQKAHAKAATQRIVLTDDLKYVEFEHQFGGTNFVGYEADSASDAKILGFVEGEGFVDIILDKTPFYAECGGQVGDVGVLENSTFKAEVLNTFKVNHLFVHRTTVINGELKLAMWLRQKSILKDAKRLKFTTQMPTYYNQLLLKF